MLFQCPWSMIRWSIHGCMCSPLDCWIERYINLSYYLEFCVIIYYWDTILYQASYFIFLDVYTTVAIYAIWVNAQYASAIIERMNYIQSWIDFVVIHIVSAWSECHPFYVSWSFDKICTSENSHLFDVGLKNLIIVVSCSPQSCPSVEVIGVFV